MTEGGASFLVPRDGNRDPDTRSDNMTRAEMRKLMESLAQRIPLYDDDNTCDQCDSAYCECGYWDRYNRDEEPHEENR
jgi:hypothetical protein